MLTHFISHFISKSNVTTIILNRLKLVSVINSFNILASKLMHFNFRQVKPFHQRFCGPWF